MGWSGCCGRLAYRRRARGDGELRHGGTALALLQRTLSASKEREFFLVRYFLSVTRANFLLGALSVVTGACTMSAADSFEEQNVPGLRLLSGQNLRETVLGSRIVALASENDGAVWTSPTPTESFTTDGSYYVSAHRAGTLAGSYTIGQDTVCSSLGPDSLRCWHLYVDDQGMYYRRYVRGSAARRVSINR
jgi:hypothetical protein